MTGENRYHSLFSCGILYPCKNCNDFFRVRLFNTQKPMEPIVDDDERERKAEAIKREIEDARKAHKENEVCAVSGTFTLLYKKTHMILAI